MSTHTERYAQLGQPHIVHTTYTPDTVPQGQIGTESHTTSDHHVSLLTGAQNRPRLTARNLVPTATSADVALFSSMIIPRDGDLSRRIYHIDLTRGVSGSQPEDPVDALMFATIQRGFHRSRDHYLRYLHSLKQSPDQGMGPYLAARASYHQDRYRDVLPGLARRQAPDALHFSTCIDVNPRRDLLSIWTSRSPVDGLYGSVTIGGQDPFAQLQYDHVPAAHLGTALDWSGSLLDEISLPLSDVRDRQQRVAVFAYTAHRQISIPSDIATLSSSGDVAGVMRSMIGPLGRVNQDSAAVSVYIGL